VLEDEIGQLKARVAALEAGHISASNNPVRAPVLADVVKRRTGAHPSKQPRKEKKEEMLKSPLNGHFLTSPALIAALREQEAEHRKKDDAKQKDKQEQAAAGKQRRQEVAAATRKRKAEEKGAQREEAKRIKSSGGEATQE
jgi:hypothetical protein